MIKPAGKEHSLALLGLIHPGLFCSQNSKVIVRSVSSDHVVTVFFYIKLYLVGRHALQLLRL